jgi:GAF domain-containing protein
VIDVFLVLADGVANGFELAVPLSALARHAAELSGVDVAAFVLCEASGNPARTVVTPDQPFLRQLCQLRPSPSSDTCLNGQPHTVTDLTTDIRWPLFATRASAVGYRSVHAMPMRQQETVLGTLALFGTTAGTLPLSSRRIARHLADLATIGIVLHRAGQHAAPVAGIRAT